MAGNTTKGHKIITISAKKELIENIDKHLVNGASRNKAILSAIDRMLALDEKASKVSLYFTENKRTETYLKPLPDFQVGDVINFKDEGENTELVVTNRRYDLYAPDKSEHSEAYAACDYHVTYELSPPLRVAVK